MMTNRLVRTVRVLVGAWMLVVAGCSVSHDSGEAIDSKLRRERAFDPTATRTAAQSASLNLAPDWQAPAPTRTQSASLKPRVTPSKQWGVAKRTLGANPSDAEIRSLSYFLEPLRPVPGTSSAAETRALAAALRQPWHDDLKIEALERFLAAFPASRWAPGLHLELATLSYDLGYFQNTLSHLKAGWELAKGGEDGVSQDVANLALAEFAKMNARLGRTEQLDALLGEAEKRKLMGNARIKVESAAEGAWMMHHRPGESFRCGPYALLNVAKEKNLDIGRMTVDFLARTQSPMNGFSVPEVLRMSTELGLRLQIAKRDVGAPAIVPSVVHWKLGHFAALLRQEREKILVKDPTFGNEEMWLSTKALDREASGYFLVPAGPLPAGWTHATADEAKNIYGKGLTSLIHEGKTGTKEHAVGGDCQPAGGSHAMARYSFHTLEASLHIEDTPIGYRAAFGPDVRVTVAYNQREYGQPAAIDFTNFGPQFVSNWISQVVNSNNQLDIALPGGGFYGISLGPSSFPGNPQVGAKLVWLSGNTYKVVYPGGRADYYEHVIDQDLEPGEEAGPWRTFLSRIADPQGREVTLEYDTVYPTRIHQLVDAAERATVFHYDYPNELYLVTSIDDPYGRSATFTYALVAEKVRLQSTQDPFGIVSSFEYNATGDVVAITTPYGKTTFNLSSPYVNSGATLMRYAEAIDPIGDKERVEFNVGAETGIPSALESPQPSASLINYYTGYNNYRNTFYWDRLLTKLAPGDYSKARRYHWLHEDANAVSSILESEVPPLENRIFYNYPFQTSPIYIGELGFPSAVGRVVKDSAGANQTQVTKLVYNAKSNVTTLTDPLGRQTVLDYDANGVDVLAIRQKTAAAAYTTIGSYTYGSGAPPHRPATATDAAGKTVTLGYSTMTGEVSTITNAKGEVITIAYEPNTASAGYGRVVTVTGDVPGGNRSFTYDGYGRVRTATNSEGYALTYDYDTLDRLRTVTYPDGSTEQLEYADHSLVATKDREGRWTRSMYNGLLQPVVTQDPTLRTTQLQWCRCGELRRFVDANGNMTEWQRDVGARVTKKIHPDGTFETFTYDSSGRLATSVDAMSRTMTYTYNVDDRPAKVDYSDTSTADITYLHDPYFPRVTTRQDGAATTEFTYQPYGTSTNGAGQIARVNGPLVDDTLKHTYDELGRLKKLEIVDDATHSTASYGEEYTFDARGRVTTVANNLGSTAYAFVGQSNRPWTVTAASGMLTQFDYFGTTGDFAPKQIKNLSAGTTPVVISQFDYTYRPDRSVDTWTVDQGSGASTWRFGYDRTHELVSATRSSGSTVLESLSYGYDKAGNRIQAGTGSAAPKNYDVNLQNQLLSERDYGPTTFVGSVNEPATVTINGQPAKVMSSDGGTPFTFEGLVNLDAGVNTVVVQAKDGQNNVATKNYTVTTTGTAKTFEYDANGNLRFEKQPNGTVSREYRWDQQNRLVRELEGTHESVYEYDGASRRVRIKELTSSVETKNETFVWCGTRICQKRASNGSTVVRSYFGNGFEQGTNDYFYTRDHLGSVREVVASDGTTVASRLSYNPWGEVSETGSGAKSDFTYTGHYYDRATGLALTWFRAYDPSIGRWLSRDPIGLRGGFNLYGYTNNSPVNYVDVDGHVPVVLWFAGIAAYAVYLSVASPTHDGSVSAGAPIMAYPAIGWVAGEALAGVTAPAVMTAGGVIIPKDPQTLSRMIDDADRRGLNAWFKGLIGPEQISTGALKVYAEIAENALNDPNKASPAAIAEQTRRLGMIFEELNKCR